MSQLVRSLAVLGALGLTAAAATIRQIARSPAVRRRIADLGPDDHATLLAANLSTIADDLERGAIASLSPNRLAVRDLPIR